MARPSLFHQVHRELDWRWTWATRGIAGALAISSFALPAWAVAALKMFEPYAPFSWVLAGFSGLFAASIIYSIWAWAKGRWVRAKYDEKLLAQGGEIDPLAKTFESKRIYLNEFCLPSRPLVENKTFIDCEIVGPANIILNHGNNITEQKLPQIDALVMSPNADPHNGYVFNNCIFRGCSFVRSTIMFSETEYHNAKHLTWFRWISYQPEAAAPAVEIEPLKLAPPPAVKPKRNRNVKAGATKTV